MFEVGKNWKQHLAQGGRGLTVVWLMLLFLIAFRPVTDPDLGWHLMTGKWMVDHQAVVMTDTFSYSLPGHEFIAHSWLLDVWLYGLYSILGLWAVGVFYTSVLVTAVVMLRLAIEKELKFGRSSWFFLPLVWVIAETVGLRSQTVSFLGLAILFWLFRYRFELGRENNKLGSWLRRTRFWMMPLLFLVWVNVHAGFLLGLGVAAAWLLSWSLVRSVSQKRLVVEPGWFFAWGVWGVSALVTLVNPYGLRVYGLIYRMVTNVTAMAYNTDWLPLLSPQLPEETLGMRLLVVALALVSLVGAHRRYQLRLLVAVFLALSFENIRFLLPLMVVVVPLLVLWVQKATREWFGSDRREAMVIAGVIGFGLALGGWYSGNSVCAYTSLDCLARVAEQPRGAVKFIRDNNFDERIFNYYTWGGYLIWQLPEHKVFIDGRMDNFFVDGRSFLDVFAEIVQMRDGWEETFEDYGADVVLLPPDWNLVTELEEREWKRVYEDELSVVLVPEAKE